MDRSLPDSSLNLIALGILSTRLGCELRSPGKPKFSFGILWSSLTQYYFFLTTSSWGNWHDKISLDEIRNLPVRLPTHEALRNRITSTVDELRNLGVPAQRVEGFDLFSWDLSDNQPQKESQEHALQFVKRGVKSSQNLINTQLQLGVAGRPDLGLGSN